VNIGFLFFVVSFFLCSGAKSQITSKSETIVLGKDSNETISLQGLRRAAIANPKIVKVRLIPPNHLLLTGKSEGKTSLRVWLGNQEKHFEVAVIPQESIGKGMFNHRGRVARVALQFLELDESVSRHSGVQWPESLKFNLNLQASTMNSVLGLNPSISFSNAEGFLNLLIKEGWARIVDRPEIYVRLKEEAVFHSGGEFPVSTGTTSFGTIQRKIEWKKYGLTAKVKTESPDQVHFQTDIQLEISEMDPSYQIDSTPSLTRRNLTTKIDSVDGETVILSGLIRRASQSEDSGLPFLGKIPLLGSLIFGKNSIAEKETEMLMAVTIEMTSKGLETEAKHTFRRLFENLDD
jgi:pilus assembly protein CpaC